MRAHHAELVLEIEDKSGEQAGEPLHWRFPIEGFVDGNSSAKAPVFEFSTPAREVLKDKLEIRLAGLSEAVKDEAFTHEILAPMPERAMIKKCLHITARSDTIVDARTPLVFDVVFEPLKVFRSKVDFVINKSSGGRWRFELMVRTCSLRTSGSEARERLHLTDTSPPRPPRVQPCVHKDCP
eukprot:3165372-Pyramimonas_sp.AAC.1